ncbi:alpha/beta hydrolase [Acetobacter fallax]|uniref:Alpha/beta hydrolase fold domain-containing protein n=1 Tax=Acetobacter fallax TaxID=1737473 RepID=A0ABX0K7G1_9PROT|nr:alpha/beta hydrolase [Acetobacter fallax]NHO32334.1 alpha/beta hydrolase fold domain-containing protein [Acetobacter fallax]NHO35893.1 alpha/beta hydrolase fold domain-containing protein [Acetobacter fallax]
MPHNPVAPEFREALKVLPSFDGLSDQTLAATRTAFITAIRSVPVAGHPDVMIEEHRVPGPVGAPDVPVVIYRPRGDHRNAPALVYIHSGGIVSGTPEVDDARCRQLVSELGLVIFSVDYRLAPEAPYPAAIEDCYAVLKWVHEQSAHLGTDRDRLVIGGDSAGGGLTACLALLARDRAEVNVLFQLLIYPMLDDRTGTTVMPSPEMGQYIWTRSANHYAWNAYLGKAPGSADVSEYASAFRATDLKGLPPAYIGVGSLDLFLDEDLEYARRLMAAGVATEVCVIPGAYHVFDVFIPDAPLSRQFRQSYFTALKRALAG